MSADPLFEPASGFLGTRPGWAFKLGPQGLGYYADAPKTAPYLWQGPGGIEAAVEVDAEGDGVMVRSLTGFKIWPAAVRLSELLCLSSTSGAGPLTVHGRRVLELGAGSGLVSAVASVLGAAEVIATDRSELLPRLRATAALRGGCQDFQVQGLEWGQDAKAPPWPRGYFDMVLGADITYAGGASAFQDLLELFSQLAGPETLTVLAHGVRGEGHAASLWARIRECWSDSHASVLSGSAELRADRATPSLAAMSDDSGEEFQTDAGGDDPCGNILGSCVMMVIGLIAFPAFLFLLGWNEKEFVCENSRILYADGHAKEVPCNSVGITNEFVYFSCPLVPSTLEKFHMCDFNRQNAMPCAQQIPVEFTSVSAKQRVEMYQCEESCETKERKDNLGRNQKVKSCSYKMVWSDEGISSSAFTHTLEQINPSCQNIQAAGGNPAAPVNLDLGEASVYASNVKAGVNPNTSFTLNDELIRRLIPDTAVDLSPFAVNFPVAAWQQQNAQTSPWMRPLSVTKNNLLVQGNYLTTCQTAMLGCVRISLFKSSSTHPSVMTKVFSGGATEKEEVPGSWGCAKSGWQAILPTQETKAGMMEHLQSMNRVRVWILRLVGLIGCWLAIFCCFQPISAAAEAAGDVINMCPCGGYIDDFLTGLVDSVLCLLSCSIGCSTGLFVIAVVWVYMRPLIGGALMAVAVLLCICAGCVRSQATKGRARKDDDDLGYNE